MVATSEEATAEHSVAHALKHAILELGLQVLDRLDNPFRKRFTLVNSLGEIGEQYQCSDLRYTVGETYVWARIMERIPIEDEFDPNNSRAMCATRCLGFVQIGRYVVAVVRQCWFRVEDPPREIINLEPVLYTTTAEYIPDRKGVGTRHGVKVNLKYNRSGRLVFELDWVDFEYRDLPWGDLLKDITPYLIREFIKGSPLIQF